MMSVELEEIRAWVDGELGELRASEVASAVASDEKLKRTADALRASALPYREAYEQAPVADVPESLRLKIDALKNPATQYTATSVASKSSFNPVKMFGIAASVMLAALVGFLAGNNTTSNVAPDTIASVDILHPENFAQTVAAYQTFYVRDTLRGIGAVNPEPVVKRLVDQTGMQVVIPELEGYEFKRAQRLSFDGDILLQMVYLGADGGPLALCYMVGQGEGGSTTTLKNHYGLNTAEWSGNGHRFVIVSDAPESTLVELSESTKQQWGI